MPEFRSGARLATVVALLAALALASMVVDRRTAEGGEPPWWSRLLLDAAVPVQKMVSTPVDVLHDLWIDYVHLIGVRETNEDLRARIAGLEEENLQLREALVASGRLQRIATMRESFEAPMLPAELVGVDASPWFRSVLLDRGRGRGVLSGMPVVSEQGLAGLVRATSKGAARAMLILDRQSAIDATVQRSRTRGIVRGRGGEELVFEFTARDRDVRVGDVLITSGLGGVYPKGLRIGEVSAVADPGARLMARAGVKPAVDFGRLEQVFVLMRRGPTMELLYAAPDGDRPEAEAAQGSGAPAP